MSGPAPSKDPDPSINNNNNSKSEIISNTSGGTTTTTIIDDHKKLDEAESRLKNFIFKHQHLVLKTYNIYPVEQGFICEVIVQCSQSIVCVSRMDSLKWVASLDASRETIRLCLRHFSSPSPATPSLRPPTKQTQAQAQDKDDDESPLETGPSPPEIPASTRSEKQFLEKQYSKKDKKEKSFKQFQVVVPDKYNPPSGNYYGKLETMTQKHRTIVHSLSCDVQHDGGQDHIPLFRGQCSIMANNCRYWTCISREPGTKKHIQNLLTATLFGHLKDQYPI
jgi:hypothetical protein